MNPLKLIEDFHSGERFTDQDLLEGKVFFDDLAAKLFACGPILQLAAREINDIARYCHDSAQARSLLLGQDPELVTTKCDIRDSSFFIEGTFKNVVFKYSFSKAVGGRIKLSEFHGMTAEAEKLILEIKDVCVKKFGLQRFYMSFSKVEIDSKHFDIEGIYDHHRFEFIGSVHGKWLKLIEFEGTDVESKDLLAKIENYCVNNLQIQILVGG